LNTSLSGMISYLALSFQLQTAKEHQPTLMVGIDGAGGSGKSTFAQKLSEHLPVVSVIHMDDFYRPSHERVHIPHAERPIGYNFDWERLQQQVLQPLSHGQRSRYQIYDWDTDQVTDWQEVAVDQIIIVEGVAATREEIRSLYNFRIWVECPASVRLARGVERDGEDMRMVWEQQWMPAEEWYRQTHHPEQYADIIVDGASLPPTSDHFFAFSSFTITLNKSE